VNRPNSGKQPFAARVQAILVVLMLLGIVLIGQQFSVEVYRIGLVLLVAATIINIAFSNVPSHHGVKRSMELFGIFMFVVLLVFGVGILIAPVLAQLDKLVGR
jgi:hypothetical protein